MYQFLNQQFGSFMSTTTISKYFPKKKTEPQQILNPIYAIAALGLIQEAQAQDPIHRKYKQRRDSIASADAKFNLTKNCQRVKSINNLFTLKQQRLRCQQIDKKLLDIKGLKKSYMKMTKLNIEMQKFQKQVKGQNCKILILDKFNNCIQNHYEKFQINEDQTRQEVIQNEKIIQVCRKEAQPERQKVMSLQKIKEYQSMKLNETKLIKAVKKYKQQALKCSKSNSFFKRSCHTTFSKFKPKTDLYKRNKNSSVKQINNAKLKVAKRQVYQQQKQNSFSVFVSSSKDKRTSQKEIKRDEQLRNTFFAPVSDSFFSQISQNFPNRQYGKSFGF